MHLHQRTRRTLALTEQIPRSTATRVADARMSTPNASGPCHDARTARPPRHMIDARSPQPVKSMAHHDHDGSSSHGDLHHAKAKCSLASELVSAMWRQGALTMASVIYASRRCTSYRASCGTRMTWRRERSDAPEHDGFNYARAILPHRLQEPQGKYPTDDTPRDGTRRGQSLASCATTGVHAEDLSSSALPICSQPRAGRDAPGG